MTLDFKSLKELLMFNIKYYRFLKGISQEKLSELSNLSPCYISNIESGRRDPTLKKVEIIAKALKVEPYILLQNSKRDEKIVKKMNSSRQYNQKSESVNI